MKFLINKCRINVFFFSLLIFIINVFFLLNFVKKFAVSSSRRVFNARFAFFQFRQNFFFIAIAYVSMFVFVLNVLLSIRFNFLFMFINFCLMSLFFINSKKNNSSTILNMRKIVESLIISKLFFQQIFYVFLHLLLAIL